MRRRHPKHVESIVLEGVAPPHFYIIPLPMARGAQTAIDGLESACRSNAACAAHFPGFAAHFAAVVRRFDAGPVTLSVENTATHKAQRVQLSKEVFVETIRHAMYVPAEANGLNLSVTCAEDIPFITEQAVVRDSSGTFEGDARVRAQQRACRIWHVAPVSVDFIKPVRSNAPILMISGSDDPATPPSYGRAALAYLPHARQMLVPGASHDSDYPPCVDATIVAFIRARSPAGLKFGRCIAAYHRPSFATLAYDEAAPGENPAQTERFRKIVASMLQGRIDRSQLTPAVSKEFSDAVLKGFAADASGLGAVQNFVFKGTRKSSHGTVYTYFLRCVDGNAVATFTLNAANRISALDISAA